MGVYLRKRGDRIDPRWHGTFVVDGKRRVVALNRWFGMPPAPGEETGDAKFERSRGEAVRLFKRLVDGETSAAEETVIEQKIFAARYGTKVGRVKLGELAARWDELPRGTVTAKRAARVRSVLAKFVGWMGDKFPKVTEVGALLPRHFREFLADVENTGCTPRTWNDYLDILRMVLGKVDGQSKGFREYLLKLPKKMKEQRAQTVHRTPFTPAQLEAIFKTARETDPELYPLVVTAACTALRRGDVARLRWEDVDMETGLAKVGTSKTGEDVYLPIGKFPLLMDVLKKAEQERKGEEPFVFPRMAKQYGVDDKFFTRHLEKVLKLAGIEKTRAGGRGGGSRKIRASVGLWHAFRATFVTLALSSGVPVQTILAITGHTSEKTLFSFYDRRTVAAFREEMGKAFSAMPLALAGRVESSPAKEKADAGADAEDGLEFVGFAPDRADAAKMLADADEKTLAAVRKLLAKGAK